MMCNTYRPVEPGRLRTHSCREIFEKLLTVAKFFEKLADCGKIFCTNQNVILKYIF